MTYQRLKIEIHGAVQGVGFRPFVYRLAGDLGLTGWVMNNAQGVFIEVEGEQDVLSRLLERLPVERPPRAIIHSLEFVWLEPTGFERFEIRHSDDHGAKTALVLPEVATCPECLFETLDPLNRRYRYPFTNCTNCGPRFTIIEALPYDRPNTTMRRFALCPACRTEYDNPLDRRFHAQPNACSVCGPQLAFWKLEIRDCKAQSPISNLQSPIPTGDDALHTAADALRAGQIVAVKGLGGFHLMADARNADTVAELRRRKRRVEKPFALMIRDLAHIRAICDVPPEAETLLTSPEAPIVLLHRRQTAGGGRETGSESPTTDNRQPTTDYESLTPAEDVAPGNPYLGVMLPATPLHHLLMGEIDFPLVATSGNLSDEPICIDEHDALERLGEITDSFLVHDRPIARHVDDSVAMIVAGAPQLLRRARGYAPLPVLLKREAPCILAVGAHLKNTVALSVGRQVFISQHIGDMETPQAITAFERVIDDFLQLYEATPIAIAHDLHPDYTSTRFAAQSEQKQSPISSLQSPTRIAVQHHHAHFAACLAENGEDGPALGVIWDGTGYGLDGTIWGGEFLLGDVANSTRVAHLRPFRLPGGDAAVREPRRVALALLWELYGPAALDRDDLPSIHSFSAIERRLVAQMLERGVNAPVTTSAGRLFDGIAALAGLHQRVSFEGQAAMALEFAADPFVDQAYPVEVTTDGGRGTGDDGQTATDDEALRATRHAPETIDWRPTVEAALRDVQAGVALGVIAARFHNAMVDVIVKIASATGESRVALSGGCFQNRLLTERAVRRLRELGFIVLLHRQVPPNDGGISLGQVATAAARLERV